VLVPVWSSVQHSCLKQVTRARELHRNTARGSHVTSLYALVEPAHELWSVRAAHAEPVTDTHLEFLLHDCVEVLEIDAGRLNWFLQRRVFLLVFVVLLQVSLVFRTEHLQHVFDLRLRDGFS